MADNPFSVQVVNPLQSLLYGQQAFKTARDSAKEDELKQARAEAGKLYSSGNAQGAIARLLGANDYAGAGNIATIQKGLAPETSPDIQAFKMARDQGFTGSILDFMKQKAEAGAARTNVSTNIQSGEKEFDKAVGKDYGETFVGLNKASRDSVGAINNLNLMENLTRDPNFYSGTGGEFMTRAKQAGVSTGFLPEGAASANELFQKVSQKSVVDNLGSLGTGVSNADRQFIQGTVANIANTPAGNREIISYGKKIEQRKQEVAKLAREYAKSHGGRIDAGFDDALAQWAEKNPLFPQSATRPPRGSSFSDRFNASYGSEAPEPPRQAPDGNFYVPDPNRPGKYLRVIQ